MPGDSSFETMTKFFFYMLDIGVKECKALGAE